MFVSAVFADRFCILAERYRFTKTPKRTSFAIVIRIRILTPPIFFDPLITFSEKPLTHCRSSAAPTLYGLFGCVPPGGPYPHFPKQSQRFPSMLYSAEMRRRVFQRFFQVFLHVFLHILSLGPAPFVIDTFRRPSPPGLILTRLSDLYASRLNSTLLKKIPSPRPLPPVQVAKHRFYRRKFTRSARIAVCRKAGSPTSRDSSRGLQHKSPRLCRVQKYSRPLNFSKHRSVADSGAVNHCP